jgi:hypothetical protein
MSTDSFQSTTSILDRLTAAERKLAIYEAERSARRAPRRRRSARFGAAVTLALLVALVPLTLFAANPFTDLTGGDHDANIDAIYNAGITTGCVPNEQYCPTDFVTREQMATFLARTAGLGQNKPAANAARLAVASPVAGGPTYAANDLVRVAYASLDTGDRLAPIGADTGTYEKALTITITAPVAGFVLVDASIGAGAERDGACEKERCGFFARLRHEATGTLSPHLATSILGLEYQRDSLSLSYLFPVSAGVQTFTLQVAKLPGQGAGIGYFNPHASALFVPFGAGGMAAQP